MTKYSPKSGLETERCAMNSMILQPGDTQSLTNSPKDTPGPRALLCLAAASTHARSGLLLFIPDMRLRSFVGFRLQMRCLRIW